MVQASNRLLGILNGVTLLLSIPIIAGGAWLKNLRTTECERFLDKPVIGLGLIIMLVSVAGLVGACFRVRWLLCVYQVVMFLVITLLLCFTVFAFMVTSKGTRETISGKKYFEYRIEDYTGWLRQRVDRNWGRIRSCLMSSCICEDLIADDMMTEAEFYAMELSPLQSGCCKPSDDCEFEYVSPKNWTLTMDSDLYNPDCRYWSNDLNTLCYDCDSCKAGLLENLKSSWKKVAIINVVFLIFLIIIYAVGFWAIMNNKMQNSYEWKIYYT